MSIVTMIITILLVLVSLSLLLYNKSIEIVVKHTIYSTSKNIAIVYLYNTSKYIITLYNKTTIGITQIL